MLNDSTRKRLLAICTKLSKKQTVSDFDLVWAQKNAIHDEEAAELISKDLSQNHSRTRRYYRNLIIFHILLFYLKPY